MATSDFGKKASLTSQSKHWWITIRKNVVINISNIKSWCESWSGGEMYAFIEHKEDICPSSGEIEGTHYHIVIDLSKRVRKVQLLNNIVEFFGFDNPFGIEVDIYRSFEGCIQYLTHQNEFLKTPHDRSEIITNIESESLNSLLDSPLVSNLNTGMLLGLITKAKNPMDLAQDLGLGTFDHYLKTIRIFWKRIKGEDL